MATCRISTAMHHSQREKLPERGGKQPPPRASPNPGARCGAEPATARPGAHRLPSPQPCPATRWGRLLALGQTASSVKVCPQEHSASLWDVQHCSRVLSIPLGCPISLQDAQSPSGMLDILPGWSASLWTKLCRCTPLCSKGLSPPGSASLLLPHSFPFFLGG